jgi:hypothetical protein
MSVKEAIPINGVPKDLQEIAPHLQQLFNWILTVETRIRFQGSPGAICGEKLEEWNKFSSSALLFPVNYHSTRVPYLLTCNLRLVQEAH